MLGDHDDRSDRYHWLGQDTSALLTVRLAIVITEFLLKHDQPGARHVCLAPFFRLMVSSTVSYNLRGYYGQGELLERRRLVTFHIGQDCHRNAA